MCSHDRRLIEYASEASAAAGIGGRAPSPERPTPSAPATLDRDDDDDTNASIPPRTLRIQVHRPAESNADRYVSIQISSQ